MSKHNHSYTKLNQLASCNLKKSRRPGRGPGSNYGKLGGRGSNGQKAKEQVSRSAISQIWKSSHQKVFIMKKIKKLNNPHFTITQNMYKNKPLPKDISFAAIKKYYNISFRYGKIKILRNGKKTITLVRVEASQSN